MTPPGTAAPISQPKAGPAPATATTPALGGVRSKPAVQVQHAPPLPRHDGMASAMLPDPRHAHGVTAHGATAHGVTAPPAPAGQVGQEQLKQIMMEVRGGGGRGVGGVS